MALLLGTAALTGGLLAVSVAESERRRVAMRAMLSDPAFHAELAHMQTIRNAIPIPVLFVHVSQVDIASQLDQARLRVLVKYGGAGHCLRQATTERQAVQSPDGLQLLANFGETLAFPGRTDVAPVLRIRLEKLGFFDQVLSKAEVSLNETPNATFDYDLCLFKNGLGRRGELIGQLQITTCIRYISRQELLAGPANPILYRGIQGPYYGSQTTRLHERRSGNDSYDADYEAAIAESLRMSGHADSVVGTAVPAGASESPQAVVVQGRVVR